MPLADLYAIGLATGYALVAVGLWRYRKAFIGLESYGIILFPILVLWVVFYASLPFVDETVHRHIYVWLSRIAHTLSIVLVFLTAKLGQAMLEQKDDVGTG